MPSYQSKPDTLESLSEHSAQAFEQIASLAAQVRSLCRQFEELKHENEKLENKVAIAESFLATFPEWQQFQKAMAAIGSVACAVAPVDLQTQQDL